MGATGHEGVECPGCGQRAVLERYEAHYGRTVEVDVCHACNGLWFDPREAQALTADSTVELLRSMRRRQDSARAPQRDAHACPRCRAALKETMDRVKGQVVTYLACPSGCGRFTTFFQFLREKHFVQDASAEQLAALKAAVKQVDCSNCGAPVDLSRGTACAHCRAPVSFLSTSSVDALLAQATASAPAEEEHEAAAAEVARLLGGPRRRGPLDVVDAGLDAVLSLLKGR